MKRLSLRDEDEGVTMNASQDQIFPEEIRLCLVGRFLSDRPVRSHIMKDRIMRSMVFR